jgi:hypothetical protein
MTDHRPITEQHWSKTLGPWPAKRPDSILLEHDERHPNHAFICDGATGRRILGLPKTLKATDTPKLPSQPITEQELAEWEKTPSQCNCAADAAECAIAEHRIYRLIAEVRHLRSANQQLNNILGTIKLEKIAKKVEADFNAPLDEELEIAEKLWVTAIKGGSWKNVGVLVPKLVAEVRRLRADRNTDHIRAKQAANAVAAMIQQWAANGGQLQMARPFGENEIQLIADMIFLHFVNSEITGAHT